MMNVCVANIRRCIAHFVQMLILMSDATKAMRNSIQIRSDQFSHRNTFESLQRFTRLLYITIATMSLEWFPFDSLI